MRFCSDVHAMMWNGYCLLLVGIVPYCAHAAVQWRNTRATTFPLFCLGIIVLLFNIGCMRLLLRAPKKETHRGIMSQLRMGVLSSCKCPLLSRIVDTQPEIPNTLQFLPASALMITTALLSDGTHSLETMVVAPLPILFHAPIASVSRAMVAWCRRGAQRSR